MRRIESREHRFHLRAEVSKTVKANVPLRTRATDIERYFETGTRPSHWPPIADPNAAAPR